MKNNSPLELLHPDGIASTSIVLGSNCPETLFPEPPIQSEKKIALFVIAPSTRECRSRGWLEEVAEAVDFYLSEDGVCYVLMPLPWRLRMIRLLSQANLVIDSIFWHFPDWAASQCLVPLQHGSAQFAVEKIIPLPAWKRNLSRQMFRYTSTRRLFGAFWKSAGICVRRRGARPLFQWLFKGESDDFSTGTALIRKSWRETDGATLLYCFPDGEELPSAVVKTLSVDDSLARPDREIEVLETLGPSARTAGIEVPRVLQTERNDHLSSLFLSPIRGRPASDLLASNPDLFSSIFAKIVGWLERWHAATVIVRQLDATEIEQEFTAPLDRLFPLLQNAKRYRDWLVQRIRDAAGAPYPLVAVHRDLTMANILVDDHGFLGVVDWETGRAASWPLVDFYYAVTDAVRITDGYNSWLEAFASCYQSTGSRTSTVGCWKERLQSSVGMTADMAELCFHACWLNHASNEALVSRAGAPRPFLEIVQWLALNYSMQNEN